MSSLKVNSVVDAAGGNTVSINGYTPTMSNMAGKNRIINGDMRIDQRGAVNVTASGGNTYIATDRFTLTNYWGSGQVNTAKSTVAPTGFTNSLGLTVATAAPMSGSTGYTAALWQSIEGFNISDAYTGTITLSFWVRSSITGTYSVTFSNVQSTSISSTSRLYVVNYTINAANTWEQKTVTLNLASGVASGTWDTTNGNGLCISWNLGAESTRKGDAFLNTWGTLGSTPNLQSNAQTNWISNAGATFYITGVQLEAGSVATPFERRPYGQELALCQRYYQQQYGSKYFYSTTGNSKVDSVQLGITMRAAPTVTKNTGSGIIGSVSVNNTFTNSVEVAGAAGTAENRELGFVLNCSSEL